MTSTCTCTQRGSDVYGSYCASWDDADEEPWCTVAGAMACGKDHTFESVKGHHWAYRACKGMSPTPPKPADRGTKPSNNAVKVNVLPGFCAPISALEAPAADLRAMDLNPNKHSCRVESSDGQILAECRKRAAAAPEKTTWISLDNAPVIKAIAKEDVDLQAKYKMRVAQGQCDTSKGMWGNPFNSRCTILTMAKMGPYLPGQTVLDWGTGCGHQATFMTKQYGVRVVGIDLNAAAIEWAKKHSAGRFVGPIDGTDLSWVPDASFDHFYSFGTVFYVRPKLMCAFGKEVARILKPGGTALFGWMDGIYSRPFGRLQKSNFDCVKALPDVDVTTPSEGASGLYSDKADDLIAQVGSYAVVMRKK